MHMCFFFRTFVTAIMTAYMFSKQYKLFGSHKNSILPRMILCIFLLTAGGLHGSIGVHANPVPVALKNNVLYDAALTPNLQLEVRLAEHWTLQAGVGFNPFPLKDEVLPKWRHLSVELAPRYWLCEAFTRDFVSFNLAYAHYNVAGGVYPIGWLYKPVQTNRFQGDAFMAGVSYGWHFALTQHFSIELEGGVDGGFTRYDRFKCKHCGELLAQEKKWFAVPRLGVNLVVLLGGDREDFEERCDCQRLHAANEAESETDSVQSDTVKEEVKEEPTAAPAAEPTEAPVIDPFDEPSDEPKAEQVVAQAETQKETPTAAQLVVKDPIRQQKMDSLSRMIAELEQMRTSGTGSLGYSERILSSKELHREIDQRIADLLQEQIELAHQDQMARLREAVLRPIDEFESYDPYEEVVKAPNSIFMHFDVDKAHVDRTFIHNDELMDSIMQVIGEAIVDTTIEIKRIKIVGMASFDGPIDANERLAYHRAKALHDYVQERLNMDESLYSIYNGGECWQELRWYLLQESFPGKEEVIRIIDTEEDFERREMKIKRLNKGQTYAYMRTHFKRYLRNLGTITVYYKPKQ